MEGCGWFPAFRDSLYYLHYAYFEMVRYSHAIKDEDVPMPAFHSGEFQKDPFQIEDALNAEIERLEESKDQYEKGIAGHLRLARDATLVLASICFLPQMLDDIVEDNELVTIGEEEESKGKKGKGKKKAKKAQQVPKSEITK